MSKNNRNSSKFKYLVLFSLEISFIDPVHSVIFFFDMGLAKIHPVVAIGGLQGTQNGTKRPYNVPNYTTVEPRNKCLAFKGSPSIKVNILRSQMVVFNVISPLFKGYPEIKVENLQSQWDR